MPNPIPVYEPSKLMDSELFWRDHQAFLQNRGYMLRPRYHPHWVPSWTGKRKKPIKFEDYRPVTRARKVLDATRTCDKMKVIIKRVKTNTEEIPIGSYFSSDLLRKDPRNHCVHILDVIPLPDNDDEALIVMPFLRPFYNPPFEFKTEYIEAAKQLLEGLMFMHEHNVSHMDACFLNIMMDTSQLIPRGFHFANQNTHDGVNRGKFEFKYRRDVAPVPYYFIDFGLSSRFPSSEKRDYFTGRVGQDRTVPEFSDTIAWDPYKVDIYQLGGVLARIESDYVGLDFLRPLVESMRQTDPSQRPDASEALEHFLKLIGTLSPDDLDTEVWRHIDLYMGEPNKWRRRPVTVLKPRPLKSLLNKLIGHLGKT
ncbi:hypothetical protein M422DRAFT_39644 [Sphaerobolus stellatus SS14]|uniref:Protein kinase domain-containing protein n=1 Tax=Sphaerobolus stellatus (strain SS14) TaxID=990650 RepID=A0A0C9UDA3_SPHS4|nr:hypothetical protein M422DRAFT_39644 [Sphaerobolus stellatus SS14]